MKSILRKIHKIRRIRNRSIRIRHHKKHFGRRFGGRRSRLIKRIRRIRKLKNLRRIKRIRRIRNLKRIRRSISGKYCRYLKKCRKCCDKNKYCRRCCKTRKVCKKSKKLLRLIAKRSLNKSRKLKNAFRVKNRKGLHKCRTYVRCGCKKNEKYKKKIQDAVEK